MNSTESDYLDNQEEDDVDVQTLGSHSTMSTVTFFRVGETGYIQDEMVLSDANNKRSKGDVVYKTLMKNKCLADIGGTLMVYIDDRYGWISVYSTPAAQFFNEILSREVPVNWYLSSLPILEHLVTRRLPSVLLPSTITISRSRYSYIVRPGVVELQQAVPLGDENDLARQQSSNSSMFKRTYCSMPTPHVPVMSRIQSNYPPALGEFGDCVACIHEVFGESTTTILWMIGDIFLDTGMKRCFVLYGPGGQGKTTLSNMIKSVTCSSSYDLEYDLFLKEGDETRGGGRINHLKKQEIAAILATRLVSVKDMDIENHHINMQTVKTITGGDATTQGVLTRTMLVSTNSLCSYEKMGKHVRTDRTRRLVIVPTLNRRLGNGEREQMPQDENSKASLVACSLFVRLMCKNKPPLTKKALLYTLFQARVTEVEDLIEHDEDAEFLECYTATRIICRSLFIKLSNMQDCLANVGYDCCLVVSGVYAIRGIRPKLGATIMRETDRQKRDRELRERRDMNFNKSKKDRVDQMHKILGHTNIA